MDRTAKIDYLITALAQALGEAGHISLLNERGKSYFIALHYLLPYTLIPALDLIDNGQIMNYDGIIFAQSTSGVQYEVRMGAWNCTCPAFAHALYSDLSIMDTAGDETHSNKYRPFCKHLVAALLTNNISALAIKQSTHTFEELLDLCCY